MIAKKGDELHEACNGCTYNSCKLVKYKKIKLIILKVKDAVSNKRKTQQGANKKNQYDDQLN